MRVDVRVGVRVDVRADGWGACSAAHIILGLMRTLHLNRNAMDSPTRNQLRRDNRDGEDGENWRGQLPFVLLGLAGRHLAHGMLTIPSWERHPYEIV